MLQPGEIQASALAPQAQSRVAPPRFDGARTTILRVGGLDISAENLSDAADFIVDYCTSEARRTSARPLFMTSVNGQILSLCARDPAARRLFQEADIIHCDGQPLVILSRLIGEVPLPERVATTDLFPVTAVKAASRGVSFYLLGEASRSTSGSARSCGPNVRRS